MPPEFHHSQQLAAFFIGVADRGSRLFVDHEHAKSMGFGLTADKPIRGSAHDRRYRHTACCPSAPPGRQPAEFGWPSSRMPREGGCHGERCQAPAFGRPAESVRPANSGGHRQLELPGTLLVRLWPSRSAVRAGPTSLSDRHFREPHCHKIGESPIYILGGSPVHLYDWVLWLGSSQLEG